MPRSDAGGMSIVQSTAVPPGPAVRMLLTVGGLVAVVLVLFARGYGYHRDELYFLAAGSRLAWAYPDQGPVTPLLARAMEAIASGSRTILRIPSALMAGTTAVLAGLIAREFGGGRQAQVLAAACVGVASVLLVVGHLLSTTTFDLLAWSLLTWLVARVVRGGDQRLWPAAGAVAGWHCPTSRSSRSCWRH